MQRLLFLLPAGFGALFSAVIAGFVLWPQWQQVQLGKNRAAELRGLEAQLPLMAGQLKGEQEGVQKAKRQQAVVLQLIAGSGGLVTFLAQLDRLAASSGVKLSLYEPLVTQAVAADAKAKSKQAPTTEAKDKDLPATTADPLLAPGLAKQEMLVSATGRYPALLSFMRQLEKLNVLVVQSNLTLALEESKDKANAPAVLPVVLKMSVATYSRK